MKKEQIAFIIVVGLLAAFYVLGRDDGKAPPGKKGKTQTVEAQSALEMAGHWSKESESGGAWSAIANNIFRAPKDRQPLKPPQLLPPPLPRLPHPGLPTLPPVGGEAMPKLRHELVPDPKLLVPASGAGGGGAQAGQGPSNGSTEDPSGGTPSTDLSEVDTSSVGMSAAEKLKLSVAEKLRLEKAQEEAKKAETERRRGLDTLVWVGGDTTYGTVKELDKKSDRYVIKDTIDRLRGDAGVTDDERKKQLEPMKFEFREDRGPGKASARAVISALNIQRIDFAPAVPLHKYHLARLHAAPDDAEKQEELAKMIFDAGEMEVAAAHFETMAAKGIGSARTTGLLADACRRLFRYDKELAVLQGGLAKYPEDVGLLARLGQLSLRLKVPAEAENAFQRVIAKDPSHALARLGLGQIQLARGAVDDAIANLRQAETGVGLDKEQTIRTYVLLGEAMLQKGQAKPATTYFSQVLDRDPANARALAGNAVAALVMSGPAAAKASIDRGREKNPLDGTLAYLEGLYLLRSDKPADARTSLLLAEELDPLLTCRVHTAMSWLMERAGKDEAALAEADQALAANPLDLDAHLQRGRALLNVGDLGGAREEYLRALEGWPDRVDILVALGDAAFRSGNYQDAGRYYARAEQKEPGFPHLLARRIYTEVQRGRRADAEELTKRIDSSMENEPVIQVAHALVYFLRGDRMDEMLRKLRLVKDKKTGSPELVKYAEDVLLAVEDNLAKERWFDDFNRTGGKLQRGWLSVIGVGINVAGVDSQARFTGTQKQPSDRPTVLYQKHPSKSFCSFATDLIAEPQTGAFLGMGIMSFQPSAKEPDSWPGIQERDGRAFSQSGLQVALSPQGKLVWRKIAQWKATEWVEIPDIAWSGSARIGIELADSQKSLYRVLVNGTKVLETDVPGMSRRAGEIELQVFCQAQVDRPVNFAADDVEIVLYKK